MITIQNAKNIAGITQTITIPSADNINIDATGLMIFPGLIDPHVHFRTPGMEQKEDWRTAARAALCGGYTTVFDMPNTLPPTVTSELLREKKAIIDAQLREVGIPLRYELFFGADKKHFDEIPKIKNDVIGIKVFMGCSTGNLVVDDDESLHAVFSMAAKQNLLVAVHAEDEAMIHARKKQFSHAKNYCDHSVIRNPEVAACAVEKAIMLTKTYGTRLYVLHTSTAEEIALIAQAKKSGLPVFAETTPHHLFLDDHAYESLQGKAVVNPPLRASQQREAVLQAINNGIIDTIGSDHAPHLESEKREAYGVCPSGMPGIETTLALLLQAHHDQLLSLEKIVSLTHTKPREIFHLEPNQDIVLVDLNKKKTVKNHELKTKCGWSAFAGRELQGWPVAVILQGQVFDFTKI